MRVWTIGHSNRPLGDFLDVLDAQGIRCIIDVRRFPGSRRQPEYGREALRDSLAARGIDYLWLPSLGGRRKPHPDSPNDAWRNESFRGYADHMESAEFAEGFAAVLDAARRAPTVLMCAEALWWRCHRSMIADALQVRGIEVLHIMGAGEAAPHPYTAPARISGGRLSYDAREGVPARAG
jgi:uncharacterized protein (DUF488 family)